MTTLLEQGFLTTIVQREQLEDDHLHSAFWLNIGWCVVLAALSFLSAGWWADVNDMPELESVIKVLSILVIVDGFVIVQQALMQRALDFKRLALRSNVATLLGAAVGVTMAVLGAGVWALVAQQVVMEVTLLLLLWLLSTWRPRLRFSVRHARDLIGFTVSVFFANLAGFFNRRSDALLMGLFYGPVAIGLYRLADRFVDIVLDVTMRPVGAVSLPVLSRLQNDPERMREAVVRVLRTTLLICVPVLLVVVAASPELVGLLGDEWERASVALQLLCLVGIGKAISYFTGPVLFAVSRPRVRALMLWLIAGVSTATVLAVGAATQDSSVDDQVLGMSASRAALFLLVLVPVNFAIVSLVTGLKLRSALPAVPGPLLSGLGALAVAWALRFLGAGELPPLLALIVVGGGAVTAAVAILLALEPDVRERARALAGRRRRSTPPPPGPPTEQREREPVGTV
jgi:PST family polysaccharide transporter